MKKGTLGTISFTDIELKALIRRLESSAIRLDSPLRAAATRGEQKLRDALAAFPPDQAEREAAEKAKRGHP